MDFILRDIKVRIFSEKLSGPLCIDYLWLEVQLFNQRVLEMFIKFSEIDPLKFVSHAQIVRKVNKLFDDKQIILSLCSQLRELEFHSHFLAGFP